MLDDATVRERLRNAPVTKAKRTAMLAAVSQDQAAARERRLVEWQGLFEASNSALPGKKRASIKTDGQEGHVIGPVLPTRANHATGECVRASRELVVAQFESRDRYGPRGPGAGVASSTSPTIQSMS